MAYTIIDEQMAVWSLWLVMTGESIYLSMEKKMELKDLIEQIRDFVDANTLIKISLSKTNKAQKDLKNIYIVPKNIKQQTRLSFTYRYKTKDEVKNYSIKDGIKLIEEYLGNTFLQGLIKSSKEEIQLLISKKGKLKIIRTKAESPLNSKKHNNEKNYFIAATNNIYLKELGVCDSKGRVKDKQQDKYKQINRYVELMSHWFEKIDFSKKLKIVDMGSGKGYLTFALYDYLVNHLQKEVSITGVELRENLVELCNNIKDHCAYKDLNFVSKDIHDFKADDIDIIIALHACDTATDLAIYKGINANAQLIVCAPCCHKQVRKDMKGETSFKSITKHGIFEERQAEMLTDSIRSLLMEREGYTTKAFEFISNEHTRKNVMLVGRKKRQIESPEKFNTEIEKLKLAFGIKRQELEDLLS